MNGEEAPESQNIYLTTMTTRSTLCIEVCVDSIDSAKESVLSMETTLSLIILSISLELSLEGQHVLKSAATLD